MHERIEDFFKYCDGGGFQKLYPSNYYIKRPDKVRTLAEVQEIDKRTAEEINYLLSNYKAAKAGEKYFPGDHRQSFKKLRKIG